MKLQVNWLEPIALRDGSRQNLIYSLDLDSIPVAPGVYVFGRGWGEGFEALYVGKATNIHARVKQQLNNLKLMQHLRNARTGRRFVVVGEFTPTRGQQIARCLPIVERAYIRHFLSDGHDLVNIQGAVLRRHEVMSSHRPMRFVPSVIYVDR